MNTTPYPYFIPADSVEALHRMQALAAFVAYSYTQHNQMPPEQQIDGMAVAAGQIAAMLNRVTDDIDRASRLPGWNGEATDDAR